MRATQLLHQSVQPHELGRINPEIAPGRCGGCGVCGDRFEYKGKPLCSKCLATKLTEEMD